MEPNNSIKSLQTTGAKLRQWIAEGRMQYLEDVLEGIEQMPRALIRLFEGHNVGKQIVRVDPAAR